MNIDAYKNKACQYIELRNYYYNIMDFLLTLSKLRPTRETQIPEKERLQNKIKTLQRQLHNKNEQLQARETKIKELQHLIRNIYLPVSPQKNNKGEKISPLLDKKQKEKLDESELSLREELTCREEDIINLKLINTQLRQHIIKLEQKVKQGAEEIDTIKQTIICFNQMIVQSSELTSSTKKGLAIKTFLQMESEINGRKNMEAKQQKKNLKQERKINDKSQEKNKDYTQLEFLQNQIKRNSKSSRDEVEIEKKQINCSQQTTHSSQKIDQNIQNSLEYLTNFIRNCIGSMQQNQKLLQQELMQQIQLIQKENDILIADKRKMLDSMKYLQQKCQHQEENIFEIKAKIVKILELTKLFTQDMAIKIFSTENDEETEKFEILSEEEQNKTNSTKQQIAKLKQTIDEYNRKISIIINKMAQTQMII